MKRTTKNQTPEPMDDSGPEHKTGVASSNTQRDCWAIKTLVEEFTALFPETGWGTTNYDGRNTALDVTFDLTSLDTQDRADAILLLLAVDSDVRVAEVIGEDGQVLVSFRANPRTQDLRTTFGLAEAWSVLIEEYQIGGSL